MALTKDHYIQLKDGCFDGTTKDDLNNLFKVLRADPTEKKIVVHFHGGLTDAASGMQTAEELTIRYQGTEVYQIFFIWETAVKDVIAQEGGVLAYILAQLGHIWNEPVFKQILMRVLQFAKGTVNSVNAGALRGFDGTLELPDESEIWKELHAATNGKEPFAGFDPTLPENTQVQAVKDQFNKTLAPDPTLQKEVQKIVNGYQQAKQTARSTPQDATRDIENSTPTAITTTLMSPSVLEQMSQQEDPTGRSIGELALKFVIGKAFEVFSRVIARFTNNTAHGFYPTVVEEILSAFYLANIGKDIWEHIKQEAEDAFITPDRGGSVFLENLKTYCQDHPSARITLVGHSAGSIYICQLLQHADKLSLPAGVTFDVVLLAPACTYQLFKDTLNACEKRIASTRIFAMKDHEEQQDVLVPGIYTHSLLYLVSGIFENAPDTSILGMQRFFRTDAPFDKRVEIRIPFDYMSRSQRNTVWSIAADGGDGLSSAALKHGDFYTDDTTLKSLGYILTNGF